MERRTPLARAALVLALAAFSGAAACDTGGEETVPVDEPVEGVEMEVGVPTLEGQRLEATLTPMNQDLLDSTPSGVVGLTVQGDSLVIDVIAEGLPPNMMHAQHLQGFQDGSPARCPGPNADANGDGVVDVTETESTAGAAVIPFHANPVSLEVEAETYPEADAQGAYTYRQIVPLDSLRSAFQQEFGGELALDQRVVFIHGVSPDANVPESAGSVMGAPARVTLPIACGEVETEAQGGGR